MNVVDSSGWLAYFADEPNAEHFLRPLKDTDLLVVPTITIYEVFKVVFREAGENEALQVTTVMQRGAVIDLTTELAIAASKLSLENGLPMADSIILATAKAYDAILWTQDSDFKNMPGVNYFLDSIQDPKAHLPRMQADPDRTGENPRRTQEEG